MPGSWRSYYTEDGSDLQVRFHNDRVANITLFFTSPSPTAEHGLARVGLDTTGWTDRTVVDTTRIWRHSVGGVTFQATAFLDERGCYGVGLEALP